MTPWNNRVRLRLWDIREDSDKMQAEMAELLGCAQQT